MFSNAYHLLVIREERCDGQKIRDDVNDAKLRNLVVDLNSSDRRLILQSNNTGACMNLRDTTLTSTALAAT